MSPLRTIVRHLVLALCVCGLAAAGRAQAAPPPDKVVLNSGSVLLGQITAITGAHVAIDMPEHAGLKIAWADIKSLETSSACLVGTRDDARFDAIVKGRSGDNLDLVVGGAPRQVPISQLEEVIGGREGVEWKGLIALGVSVSTGNTNRRSANAKLDVTRRTADDRANLKVRWNQETTKDPVTLDWARTDQYLGGTLRYDRFISSRLFYYGRVGAEKDLNAQLDLRASGDVGLGYQVLDRSDLSYSILAGIGYMSENFKAPTTDEDFGTATLSHNLGWKIVDGLELLHDLAVTMSLESSDDVLAKGDTRLRWSMISDMFAELQWVIDYDNTPATGAERIDNRYFLSFGWNF